MLGGDHDGDSGLTYHGYRNYAIQTADLLIHVFPSTPVLPPSRTQARIAVLRKLKTAGQNMFFDVPPATPVATGLHLGHASEVYCESTCREIPTRVQVISAEVRKYNICTRRIFHFQAASHSVFDEKSHPYRLTPLERDPAILIQGVWASGHTRSCFQVRPDSRNRRTVEYPQLAPTRVADPNKRYLS